MAFQHYRTRAVFLKQEGRGEADQLFTVFSKEFGKLEILGRAIRKITSKLRSSAQLFYLSEIEFIQGKNYKTLTDAVVIDKFKEMQERPEAMEALHKIAVLFDLLGKEEADDRIWQLLLNTFQSLQRSDLCKTCRGLTSAFFFWNFVSLLGYEPELYTCASCGKKLLPETLFFCPEQGGVVCWQCKKQEKQCKEISVDVIKALRLFLGKPVSVLNKLKIDKQTQENLEIIFDFYQDYLTGTLVRV